MRNHSVGSRWAFAAAAALLLSRDLAAETPEPPRHPRRPSRGWRGAATSFGFDLYRRLRRTPGNLVISPASITTALTMTWGGARGETAAQMRRVLHLEGTADEVMAASGELARSLQDPLPPDRLPYRQSTVRREDLQARAGLRGEDPGGLRRSGRAPRLQDGPRAGPRPYQ